MSLSSKLLAWFEKNKRPLPWRRHYRPYDVWVSEIMLQQTQMDTVLPYFERWMKSFPTLRSLADSDEKKVLKHWEGLGYYSRARNLHYTAKEIIEKHGGHFPDQYESILALKGVGRYTAGAIASIAFNQERPIVDGNVIRVLARLFAIDKAFDQGNNKEIFWSLQEKLIPKGQARFFNQALMELGALVCTPQNPSCVVCPVRTFCKAYANDEVEKYPIRKKRKKMVKVTAAALVLQKGGKYFIHRRPVGKIMGGLWEFPEWKLAKGQQLPFKRLKLIGQIKRNYTHHLETLRVFKAPANGLKWINDKKSWESAWVTKDQFHQYPFSSAHLKITKL
ncbi:MAG TPA: A/G-specific adenine glycosylase, partial [Candidatus Omnitrophota bacterium]|nr:A/G-specific adenine glycosylase [Candidatus Omnitrophota bacterium]